MLVYSGVIKKRVVEMQETVILYLQIISSAFFISSPSNESPRSKLRGVKRKKFLYLGTYGFLNSYFYKITL